MPPAPPKEPAVKAQVRADVAAVTYPKVAATAVKLLSATCQ
jgi:hypothetical protein